ncbi:GIN domain-containing protein [Riemerella columbina]|uniref:GIN domain-containing protein n=1 Tax=Riemerella columbina TaxID=103810 RepID=UPI00036EF94B|nr:DUF2807 domain-containing protein [Riemerella columbina]
MRLSLLFLVSLFIVSSCGKIKPEGQITSKDLPIENFSKINLKGKYRLFFVPGEENFINIETYPNLTENLDINIKDSTLNIIEDRTTGFVDFYTVTVYSKTPLKQVSISDSVEMNVSGKIKIPEFKLSLKDQAKFIGGLEAQKTTIDMTQKSRANFLGKSREAILNIKDTASIISPYWDIDYLTINSKNDCYSELVAKEEISGNIDDTSKLLYYGNPLRKLKIGPKTKVENKQKP